MIGRDGCAGLAVLAVCAALYWLTLGLKGSPLVPIGPEFYPRIVIGITAALAALLVGADLLAARRRRAVAPPAGARPNYAMVLATFAVFGAYVVALPGLGYRLATFVFLLACGALLGRPRGARAWAGLLALAAVTTMVTYLVFEAYLAVLLPRGRLTGF